MIRRKLRQQNWEPYIFESPYIIIFLLFSVFPICFSQYISFQACSGMGEPIFVGLSNYAQLLTEDVAFWRSLWITFLLLIFGSLTQHLFAIPLAILLNNRMIKFKGLFKAAFFLPYTTSAVSWLLFAIILISTIVNKRIVKVIENR
ncbi:MAG: sugar ABC transporter permease [Spirochaetales bacterium]|nr:sugar ABC transporter permease [Spirochaetales bacterium]